MPARGVVTSLFESRCWPSPAVRRHAARPRHPRGRLGAARPVTLSIHRAVSPASTSTMSSTGLTAVDRPREAGIISPHAATQRPDAPAQRIERLRASRLPVAAAPRFSPFGRSPLGTVSPPSGLSASATGAARREHLITPRACSPRFSNAFGERLPSSRGDRTGPRRSICRAVPMVVPCEPTIVLDFAPKPAAVAALA